IAFPGTKLYDIVKENGRFIIDRKNVNLETYNLGEATFEIWDLKSKDLNKAFRRYYALFYLRPQKILKIMRQIKSIIEAKNIIGGALDVFYSYLDKLMARLFGINLR
ncbi:MAG: hypothetical protein ACTSRA_15265, partial [Promethearchaeota archaeon]